MQTSFYTKQELQKATKTFFTDQDAAKKARTRAESFIKQAESAEKQAESANNKVIESTRLPN